MKKHRINTTISVKHWEILRKHAAKYESQQKTLELALESLVNNEIPGQKLTPIEQIWLQTEKLNVVCLLHKDIYYELFKIADCELLNELFMKHNMAEYMIVMYYNKPLKECSLKEVMDGLVVVSNAAKVFDSINYWDEDTNYIIKITHSARTIKYSNSVKILLESLFKAYGLKIQCEISFSSIFSKVPKNQSACQHPFY